MKEQKIDSIRNQPQNTPRLTTSRLRLRRFTPEDLPALFELLQDEEVNTFLPWFPMKTLEEAEQFLYERYLNLYSNPIGYHYAICLKEKDIPIGYIGISDGPSHDLGYGLKKEYWHQGIASEAAEALLKLVKKDGAYPFLTATHDIQNPNSGGVMKKIGMAYRYTYEEQWMPKNQIVHFRMYQIDFDGGKSGTYREYWDKYPNHFVENL